MKRRIADGSVGFPHVGVGHRQAPIPNPRPANAGRGFVFARKETGTIGQVTANALQAQKRLNQTNKKAPGE